MPSAGKRFVKGLVRSARGVSKAWVDALIREEEEREAEKARERQARIDALKQRNIESQIAAREAEPKEERKGFALSPGQKRFEYNEETGQFEEVAGLPPKPTTEKRPEDVTGIGEFEDVVGRRRKETEAARKKATNAIMAAFPGRYFTPETKDLNPEDLVAAIRASVPAQIKQKKPGLFTGDEMVANPEFERINQILSSIEIPPEFQLPKGEGAVALADSIETARTDPSMAAAVLDFKAGAKPIKLQGKVPSVQELVDMLKGQKASGAKIKWDEIAKDFPAIDIDDLKKKVGE